MSLTPGNWSIGKHKTCIVSDIVPKSFTDLEKKTGHDETGYYGGFLLAESIGNSEDAELFAASKNILIMASQLIRDVNRADLESVRNLKALINKFI